MQIQTRISMIGNIDGSDLQLCEFIQQEERKSLAVGAISAAVLRCATFSIERHAPLILLTLDRRDGVSNAHRERFDSRGGCATAKRNLCRRPNPESNRARQSLRFYEAVKIDPHEEMGIYVDTLESVRKLLTVELPLLITRIFIAYMS